MGVFLARLPSRAFADKGVTICVTSSEAPDVHEYDSGDACPYLARYEEIFNECRCKISVGKIGVEGISRSWRIFFPFESGIF